MARMDALYSGYRLPVAEEALPPVPEEARRPLLPAALRRKFRQARRKAPGLDGLSAEHVLLQPDLCFQALAGIFNAAEATGKWPRALHTWRTAFLPKQADEAKALPTP
eukprot:11535459-Alexandrium_andersonii.AAC.1